MGAMASQITSLAIVYSSVSSGAVTKKNQSSASLAFVWGIHRWPVNSPLRLPVTRKIFPFDDAIMRSDALTHNYMQPNLNERPFVMINVIQISQGNSKIKLLHYYNARNFMHMALPSLVHNVTWSFAQRHIIWSTTSHIFGINHSKEKVNRRSCQPMILWYHVDSTRLDKINRTSIGRN